jgi:hypothetical protein
LLRLPQLLDKLDILSEPIVEHILYNLKKISHQDAFPVIQSHSLILLVTRILKLDSQVSRNLLTDILHKAFAHQMIPVCNALLKWKVDYQSFPEVWELAAKKFLAHEANESAVPLTGKQTADFL